MSSISANPFALLSGGDSDDEGPAIPKVTTKPVSVAPQPKNTIPGQQVKRDRSDYPTRGAPRKVYGGQNRPTDVEVIGDKPTGLTDNYRDDRAERRGGGGGSRGRGGRGRGERGRGGVRSDQRPDRHSATGVHDTDRKVASGWGAEEGKQELQAETDGYGDAKAALTPGVEGEDGKIDLKSPAANGDAAEPQWGNGGEPSPPVVDEEEKMKTFEEYLAEKAVAISNLPTIKNDTRKPNEGLDDSQWKGAIQLIKGQEEEEVFLQISKEKKTSHPVQKKPKEKTFIDVEPIGYRPPRLGSDRGGRGRGGGGRGRGDRDGGEGREHNNDRPRGGRGRGGNRGGFGVSRSTRELNTEDSSAFPSLS